MSLENNVLKPSEIRLKRGKHKMSRFNMVVNEAREYLYVNCMKQDYENNQEVTDFTTFKHKYIYKCPTIYTIMENR